MGRRDRNKAYKQDWNIVQTAGDEYELRHLTGAQQQVLVSLCEYLGWRTRWENAPDQDTLKAFQDQLIYDIITEVDCMNCEELTECLQPFFDLIEEMIAQNQATLEQVKIATSQSQVAANSSAAQPPAPIHDPEPGDHEAIYAGALALVREMHRQNQAYYTAAEASAVDNINEAIATFISAVPLFNELPFDELFELVDAKFQNTAIAYNAAYTPFEEPAAFDLYCRIVQQTRTFSFEVWGAWLDGLEAVVPSNAAATLFARYAPVRQTFLNQVAALVNRNQSLESYFQTLYQQYYAGMKNPIPVPTGLFCSEPETLFFDVQPPAELMTIDVDNGQWASGDARLVGAPGIVNVDLGDTHTVVSVVLPIAFGTETGMFCEVESVLYDLVRGFHYPGSETYDYTATIPSVSTTHIELQLNTSVALAYIYVNVAP